MHNFDSKGWCQWEFPTKKYKWGCPFSNPCLHSGFLRVLLSQMPPPRIWEVSRASPETDIWQTPAITAVFHGVPLSDSPWILFLCGLRVGDNSPFDHLLLNLWFSDLGNLLNSFQPSPTLRSSLASCRICKVSGSARGIASIKLCAVWAWGETADYRTLRCEDQNAMPPGLGSAVYIPGSPLPISWGRAGIPREWPYYLPGAEGKPSR